MKNGKIRLGFILSVLSSCIVASCKYVPEEIADVLNGMSFYNAYSSIGKIDFSSTMKSYDDMEFEGEIKGLRTQRFTYSYLGRTDSEITILDAAYVQHFEGSFVEDGISDKVETISYDVDKGTYLISIVTTTNGNVSDPDVQDKGDGYYKTLEDEVFGDDDTHQNGLYYGQFLQTLAGNFHEMMSYDEDTELLTYDPPVTGKYVEHPENFADMIYKVDKLGMLVYSQGKYYDTDKDFYAIEEINVSYEGR